MSIHSLVKRLWPQPGQRAAFGERRRPVARTGSGSMLHRVILTSATEVGDEGIDWLRTAYKGTR